MEYEEQLEREKMQNLQQPVQQPTKEEIDRIAYERYLAEREAEEMQQQNIQEDTNDILQVEMVIKERGILKVNVNVNEFKKFIDSVEASINNKTLVNIGNEFINGAYIISVILK